jgi:peptidoglycan/LPS O-acetylase OafA/YrhL
MTRTSAAGPEVTAEGAPARRLGYVPALDGMRAVAITLVVLFHYPWANTPVNPYHGGFLGVDVFFVLSGFLITTLLLEEHRGHGRVSLRGFYARRARRLLPALAVLFVIAVAAHFGATTPNLRPSTTGLFGMAFYMANWVQIWRNDPLGGMFGHTWSLAIEEQFYLVFPLLLLGLLRVGLRRIGLVLALVAGALASWSWRAALWHSHPTKLAFVDFYAAITGRVLPATNPFRSWNRWYFGTDTRADALLIGCAVAALFVHLARRPPSARVARVAAIVVVVPAVVAGVVVAKAAILDGWVPDWGLFLLECSVGLTVLGVVLSPSGLLTRVLSFRPFVWIGRRSYAIYLFHLVVFEVFPTSRTHLSSTFQFWFLMAMTLVAAEISWRLVESPFMKGRRRFERERPAPGLAASG